MQHQTAKDIVYEGVLDWIVTGVLEPGERIVDTDLAAYFSVSRTPVREALQSLAELEMVEIVPSYGTKVSEIVWDDIKQNYRILIELQGFAVREAINNLNEDDFYQLKKFNDEFAKATEEKNSIERTRADEAFHRLIISKAKNKYLSQYLNQLMLRIRRIECTFFGDTLFTGQSIQEHNQLIKLFQEKKVEEAVLLAMDNWRTSEAKANLVYENMKEEKNA